MKNKKLSLVVDTQVYIDSLSNDIDDSCVKISSLIESKRANVLFSQDTFGELIYILKHWSRRNIDDKKDRLDLLHDFVDLFYNSLSINTYKVECLTIPDPSDEMFLKCAIKGNVDYLISDDFKSGLHNVECYDFKVVSSEEFIKIYEEMLAV